VEQLFLEEMMNRGLVRLRAKTDRDLAVVIQSEVERALAFAADGRYSEAAHSAEQARAWMKVSNLPAAERERLMRQLEAPATACA
jgi:hypothetical protein